MATTLLQFASGSKQDDRHQPTFLDTPSKLRVPSVRYQNDCPTVYRHLWTNTPQQAALHVVEDGVVFNDGQVLYLTLELLVRVHARAEHLRLLRSHLTHLLRHLVGSYRRDGGSSVSERGPEKMSGKPGCLPLSLPRIKLKMGCRPKKHKKYHEMLDIHRGSMSLVATPACSMLLNLMVKGNGSFTAQQAC